MPPARSWLIALLFSTTAALALGRLGLLWMARSGHLGITRGNLREAMQDPDVRAAVVDALAAQAGGGIFDLHPDPFVGKTNLPRIRNREIFSSCQILTGALLRRAGAQATLGLERTRRCWTRRSRSSARASPSTESS